MICGPKSCYTVPEYQKRRGLAPATPVAAPAPAPAILASKSKPVIKRRKNWLLALLAFFGVVR